MLARDQQPVFPRDVERKRIPINLQRQFPVLRMKLRLGRVIVLLCLLANAHECGDSLRVGTAALQEIAQIEGNGIQLSQLLS